MLDGIRSGAHSLGIKGDWQQYFPFRRGGKSQ